MLVIGMILCPLGLFAGLFLTSDDDTLRVSLTLISLALFGFGLFMVWLGWIIPFIAAKSAMKNPANQGTVRTVVSRDGIFCEAGPIRTEYAWKVVLGAKEYADMFVLRYHQNYFGVLPKRFASSEDVAAFRLLLRDALGEKAELIG